MLKSASIVISILLIFQGCGNSDVDEFIDNYKDKKIVATNEDENLSLTQDIKDMLAVHNEARKEVGIEKGYVWSDKIAKDAQSYANEIAKSGVWGHDPNNHVYENGPYGENLYASTKRPTFKKAAQSWVDEKEYYHYGRVNVDDTCDVGKQCGHYTQIIWEESSYVGCGMSQYETGSKKGWYVIVCKYKTPGNYVGEYPYSK